LIVVAPTVDLILLHISYDERFKIDNRVAVLVMKIQWPLIGPLLNLFTTRIEPIADVGYAKYLGYVDQNDIVIFKGIKYARAPIGELRWKAPVPIEKEFDQEQQNAIYPEIIDATQDSLSCIVEEGFFVSELLVRETRKIPVSEDCLSLNIQTPTLNHSAGLPVLVNIHGGGYLAGDKDVSGTYFIHQSNNSLVYVSISYRLGLLGFLSGDQVEQDGDLNAGLLDQRLALDWVVNHITAFGGDPSKVTIMGDSAGGASVTYQLAAFDGEGPSPFTAAIANYPWWTPIWTRETQNYAFNLVLAIAKCDSLACLRSLDTDTIRQVSYDLQRAAGSIPQNGYGLFSFSPVIDGNFVRRKPSESFLKGLYKDVPLITSRTKYEGNEFTPPEMLEGNQKLALESSIADFKFKWQDAAAANVDSFLETYPPLDYPNIFEHRSEWFGDAIVNCPSRYIAESKKESSSWKLVFSTGSMRHGAFVPHTYSETTETAVLDQKTSKDLTKYLVSFVLSGDPNTYKTDDSIQWKTYNSEQDQHNVLHFKVKEHLLERDPDQGQKCQFWTTILST
jgi:carboxylesterase type B